MGGDPLTEDEAERLVELPNAVPAVQAQSIDISGFIKSSYYYDTRQVVAAREGDFLLYPAPETEATDTDNLLFFPFFSRLRLAAGDLPEVLGAEVSGFIETDFDLTKLHFFEAETGARIGRETETVSA